MKRTYIVAQHCWGTGPSGEEYDLDAGPYAVSDEKETALLDSLVLIDRATLAPVKSAKSSKKED
jgi:hypothetical protein